MNSSRLDDIEFVKRENPFNSNNHKTENFPKYQMDVYEGNYDIECVLSTTFEGELFYIIYNMDKYLRKTLTNKQLNDIIEKMLSDININIGYKVIKKLNKK